MSTSNHTSSNIEPIPKLQWLTPVTGSEENYQFIEEKQIEGFIKLNYFHKEQTRKFMEDIIRRENHYYTPETDCFYCPMGQKMQKACEGKRKTSTGFEHQVSFYHAQN